SKHQPFHGSDKWSFPSGHAAGLTVLVLALLKHADNTGLELPRFTVKAMWCAGGLARAVLGVHWVGDVVAGWVWGWLVWSCFGRLV
ncbi:MAG: phosphatase PAP2 family protein, partial [Pseudomonadota bacterium]|nr:phosphatase PAP2 family protein [Pseudomonadota bacterium]